MSLYKTEFPNFDTELKIPEGYEDHSYHNDVMPRAYKVSTLADGTEIIVSIWQDYANEDLREWEDTTRYCLQIDVNGVFVCSFPTNEWSEIERLVEGVIV